MHRSVLAALAALLALPAVSLAADRSATLDADHRAFSWDTAAGPGLFEFEDCDGNTSTCDSTLVTVAEPGELVASIVADPTLSDVNLRIWGTNGAGEPDAIVAEGNGLTAEEKLVANIEEPGRYVVEIVNETGYGAVHGTAELLGDDQEFSVAAPEKKTTLNTEKATYTWDGIGGNGLVFDCGELAPALQPCDQVLVHITEPGSLAVTMSDAAPTTVLDYLSIYTSDKAGTKSDDRVIAQGIDFSKPNQQAAVGGLEPGYYLVEIGWLVAANGTYKGTVDFAPTPPDEEEEEL